MRIPSEFPDGFGSDPTMMLGPCGDRREPDARPAASSPLRQRGGVILSQVEPAPKAGVAVSSRASYEPGPADQLHAAPADVRLDPLGFHIDAVPGDEGEPARRREPAGIVVTTVVVGLILAAMGYFLDMH